MLSQKYRFHSRGGVRYVFQHGKTIRTPIFSLVFMRNSRGCRRCGVVVSKKVLKTAVGRNRIRRRVYEALRLELADFPEPMDYLFVVYNKSVADMPFLDLRRTVRELLSRSLTEADIRTKHHRQPKSF